MTLGIQIVIEKASFIEEFLPTLIATLVGGAISIWLALFLFKAENNRDNKIREADNNYQSNIRKLEIDKQWYLQVLVNPNLESIESFFKLVNDITIETFEQLILAKNGSVKEFNELKAFRRVKFKNELRKFEYSFIILIQTNSPQVSTDLMEWIRSFDDIISTFEDQIIQTDNIDRDQLIMRLSSSKAEFFKTLSKPLKE